MKFLSLVLIIFVSLNAFASREGDIFFCEEGAPFVNEDYTWVIKEFSSIDQAKKNYTAYTDELQEMFKEQDFKLEFALIQNNDKVLLIEIHCLYWRVFESYKFFLIDSKFDLDKKSYLLESFARFFASDWPVYLREKLWFGAVAEDDPRRDLILIEYL